MLWADGGQSPTYCGVSAVAVAPEAHGDETWFGSVEFEGGAHGLDGVAEKHGVKEGGQGLGAEQLQEWNFHLPRKRKFGKELEFVDGCVRITIWM